MVVIGAQRNVDRVELFNSLFLVSQQRGQHRPELVDELGALFAAVLEDVVCQVQQSDLAFRGRCSSSDRFYHSNDIRVTLIGGGAIAEPHWKTFFRASSQ